MTSSLPGRVDRPGTLGGLTWQHGVGQLLATKKTRDAWTKWWKSFRENGGIYPWDGGPLIINPIYTLYHVAIYWVYHGISHF